jgi:hypothetical protein
MNESESNSEFFELLARKASLEAAPPAPSSLKSRIYTRLLQRQSESGPLMSLSEVQAGLCVFEKMIAISPLGDRIKRFNPCSVCHARVLAEHLEHAPIYWGNCPYTGFQNR